MATLLPDINCWIKVIDTKNGKNLHDGTIIEGPIELVVRYSIANDSHKDAGPLVVAGMLFRNNVTVTSQGQPNVVPAQTILIHPLTVWVKEFTVLEVSGGIFNYQAKIIGDPFNPVKEEDESNNLFTFNFSITVGPA